MTRVVQGDFISSETWVGLTLVNLVSPILLRLMGVWQTRLGKVVEHPSQSQPSPSLRADESPCSYESENVNRVTKLTELTPAALFVCCQPLPVEPLRVACLNSSKMMTAKSKNSMRLRASPEAQMM